MERIWSRFEGMGDGLVGSDDPEFIVLLDRWVDLIESLPAIDGFKVEAKPLLPTEATEWRVHLGGLPLIEESMPFWNALAKPGEELAIYRSRMEQARLGVMRTPVFEIVGEVDNILDNVVVNHDSLRTTATWQGQSKWSALKELTDTLIRLSGGHVPRKARWADLQRHIAFAEPHDLYDIVKRDWPSIRAELNESFFGEWEPLPIQTDDLNTLAVSSESQSPVSASFDWGRLTPEQFEGVIFEIIRDAEGYENANWLMRTNAADRGRDIEVYRLNSDSLSITRRLRVMVQCKHWRDKSVGRLDLIKCLESIKLWEPPRVDVLILATSGRFSQDSVALSERKEADGESPLVELWSDSHIEALLGHYSHIVAKYGLR